MRQQGSLLHLPIGLPQAPRDPTTKAPDLRVGPGPRSAHRPVELAPHRMDIDRIDRLNRAAHGLAISTEGSSSAPTEGMQRILRFTPSGGIRYGASGPPRSPCRR